MWVYSIESVSFVGISDPFSSISHFIGALAFILLSFELLNRGRGGRLRMAALVIYTTGVVSTLLVSAAFHLVTTQSAHHDKLLHLDHAIIFFLIAASFTPIHIIQFRGFMRWGVLAFVWCFAIAGGILKLFFFDDIPEWLSLSFYLGLGWGGLVTAMALYRIGGIRPIRNLFLGAFAYTTGALLDFIDAPTLIPGVLAAHEIFHLLVLAGIGCHWVYIREISNIRR